MIFKVNPIKWLVPEEPYSHAIYDLLEKMIVSSERTQNKIYYF
jgi:hypothetical protein